MNDKQFDILCKKLDLIYAIIAAQSIEDKNDKIYVLKQLGLSGNEIAPIVKVKNVHQMEGWKRK